MLHLADHRQAGAAPFELKVALPQERAVILHLEDEGSDAMSAT